MDNMKYIIIITLIIIIFQVACKSVSNKDRTKLEFEKLDIVLNDNFNVVELKISGLTDYTIDIEFIADSLNFNTISEFIRDKPGFFIGDTTMNIELFNNNNPYVKDKLLFWEEYRPTKISYEYRRIKADIKSRIIKFHYLDEE